MRRVTNGFFDGANPNYSTEQFPTNICYDSTGDYNVKLVAHNGSLTDTAIMYSVIGVYPIPEPIIVVSTDTLLCTNEPSGSDYRWFYNGAVLLEDTFAEYIATVSGTYMVQVTTMQGCIGFDTVSIDISVGISEVDEGNFIVYPNPANDLVTIYGNDLVGNSLTIYNTLGQEVKNSFINRQAIIDVHDFPAGVYTIMLESKSGFYVRKLTIEHR
jgi:hypothetical protein